MYYRCKNGRKVVHLSGCRHLNGAEPSSLITYDNLTLAEEKGCRVCKHCAGLKFYFEAEQEQIKEICKENGIAVHNMWAFLLVDTVYDQWKIVYDEKKKRIRLFHKNSFDTGISGLIPYYHAQNCNSKTIAGYLDYIIKHDDFRHANPIRIRDKKSKSSAKPKKGTNAWNKQQKKKKREQKRRAIRNVLDIIDGFQMPSAS